MTDAHSAPAEGPRYATLIDQLAAWMAEREAERQRRIEQAQAGGAQ